MGSNSTLTDDFNIFISYSHKDKDFVTRFHEALTDEGFSVWRDTAYQGGDTWPLEILKAHDNSYILLYILTENSLISPYCHIELWRAREHGFMILPVYLEDASKDHPLERYKNNTGKLVSDTQERYDSDAFVQKQFLRDKEIDSIVVNNFTFLKRIQYEEINIALSVGLLNEICQQLKSYQQDQPRARLVDFLRQANQWNQAKEYRQPALLAFDLNEIRTQLTKLEESTIQLLPGASQRIAIDYKDEVRNAQESVKRKQKYIRWGIGAGFIFLFIAILLMFNSAQEALRQQDIAEAALATAEVALTQAHLQTERAESQSLALAAQQALMNRRPDAALVLATGANLIASPSDFVQRVLRQALYEPGTRQILTLSSRDNCPQSIDYLSLAPDASQVLLTSSEGRLYTRMLLNRATAESPACQMITMSRTFLRAELVHGAEMDRIDVIGVYDDDGERYVQRYRLNNNVLEPAGDRRAIIDYDALAISTDGRYVLAHEGASAYEVYDLQDPSAGYSGAFDQENPLAIGISNSGELVAGYASELIVMAANHTGQMQTIPLTDFDSQRMSMDVSGNGETVVIGSPSNRTAILQRTGFADAAITYILDEHPLLRRLSISASGTDILLLEGSAEASQLRWMGWDNDVQPVSIETIDRLCLPDTINRQAGYAACAIRNNDDFSWQIYLWRIRYTDDPTSVVFEEWSDVTGVTQPINDLIFSPAGQYLVTISSENALLYPINQLTSPEIIQDINPFEEQINQIAMSQIDAGYLRILLHVDANLHVILRQENEGETIELTCTGETPNRETIQQIALSQDGQHAVIAFSDASGQLVLEQFSISEQRCVSSGQRQTGFQAETVSGLMIDDYIWLTVDNTVYAYTLQPDDRDPRLHFVHPDSVETLLPFRLNQQDYLAVTTRPDATVGFLFIYDVAQDTQIFSRSFSQPLTELAYRSSTLILMTDSGVSYQMNLDRLQDDALCQVVSQRRGALTSARIDPVIYGLQKPFQIDLAQLEARCNVRD